VQKCMESFVEPTHEPPQPQPIEAKACRTAGVTIPRRCRFRLRYESAVLSRVIPHPTYGFSRGSMSTASPYACIDQWWVLPPLHGDAAAFRHSNDAVTSPLRSGCGPYVDEKAASRIGNRIR